MVCMRRELNRAGDTKSLVLSLSARAFGSPLVFRGLTQALAIYHRGR